MLSDHRFRHRAKPAASAVRVEMAVRTFGTPSHNKFGVDPAPPSRHRRPRGDRPRDRHGFDFRANDRIGHFMNGFPCAQAARSLRGRIRPLGEPCRQGWAIGIAMRSATTRGDRVEWWIDRKLVAAQARVGAPNGMDGPSSSCVVRASAGGLFHAPRRSRQRSATADDNPPDSGLRPHNWEDRFGQGGQVSFASSRSRGDVHTFSNTRAFPIKRLRPKPKGVRRTYEALLACPLRAMVLACLASPRPQRWEVRESLRADRQ